MLTLAALTITSVSPAAAHVAACDGRPVYTLCAIHHWRDAVWRLERRIGAHPTRYGWTAERSTASAAYRVWVRGLWYRRWVAWHRRAERPWPASWLSGAVCIHQHEGAWNDQTGNGYLGGFQFLPATWAAHGGLRFGANPALLPPRDQLTVAYWTWRDDGGSWHEWGTAAVCGLP